jgi:hypothetical protein
VKEIEDIIGLDCTNILKVSAKQGIGIEVRAGLQRPGLAWQCTLYRLRFRPTLPLQDNNTSH